MNYLFSLLISLGLPLSFVNTSAPRGAVEAGLADSVITTSAIETEGNLHEQFEDSVQELYDVMHLNKIHLSFEAFRYGMIGYNTVQQQGRLNHSNLLTIIDFTKPSTEKRFYTIDLTTLRVIYHTYVSHGKNTGENEARAFSNIVHSNQSSLGFYLTAETYVGSKGYSLKLDGLEKNINDNMRARAVVIHEADYVSEYWIKKYGRLGRSQGCPALPVGQSKKIIDTIKGHSLIFAYFHDENYLRSSAYLNLDQVIQNQSALATTAE